MPQPPKKDESKSDFMKRCIPTYINEGYPKDQSTAMCYSMWRKKHPEDKKKARGDGQGQDGDRQGDGGADICVCPECGYETEHDKGTPCNEMTCPECGSNLVGKDKEESMSLKNIDFSNLTVTLDEAVKALYIMANPKTLEIESPKRHIHIDLLGNIKIIDKSDSRKIIAGYASLAVIDTENEYIPVKVLQEGLNTLMKDESYSNIMIVHKNIQIGKILKEYEELKTHVDDKGLFIVAEIRDDLEIAKATWIKIEEGEIRGFSIGGEIIEDHEECGDDGCIKVIDKINLFEISVCSNPVNKDSGFEIINKCDVDMLDNNIDKMKKSKKDEPEVEEKSKDEDCKDCDPKELEEPQEEIEEEVKTNEEPELPKEELLSKSDIIETIRETITETLKAIHEKELQEKEDDDEDDDDEEPVEVEPVEEEKVEEKSEKVEETDEELEMAVKARDEAIEGFRDEIKKLKEQVKKLEETEEVPKTSVEEKEPSYEKDSGIIIDKRHGRIYKQ